MAESVSYTWDGADVDGTPGTLVANISGANPGDNLWLFCNNGGTRFVGPEIADGSGNATIVNSNVRDNGPTGMLVYCENDGPSGTGFRPFAPGIAYIGTPGVGGNRPDMDATWDPSTGNAVVTLTPTGDPTDPFSWYDGGDGYDGGGTLSSLPLTLGMSGIDGADLLVVEVNDPTVSWEDVAVWLVIPGDPVLYSPDLPPPPPPHTIRIDPTSGCGSSETVRVTGSNFTASDPITVTFDGSAVSFSQADVALDGTINGTFDTPASGTGSYNIHVATAHGGASATYSVSGPAVTLTPTEGPPGTLVTMRGTCFCASDTISVYWREGINFGWPALFQETLFGADPAQNPPITVGSDGSFTVTFTVPLGSKAGDWSDLGFFGAYLPPVISFTGTDCSYFGENVSFTPCARTANAEFEAIDSRGIPVTTPFPRWDPMLRPNTATVTQASLSGYALLDFTDTTTDFWMLFKKPSSAWTGTSFPPPDPTTKAPLAMYRFPKDGSAVITYDVGNDLPWAWVFDSNGNISTPFCPPISNPCVDCTPGNTGYWWRGAWWFKGYQKWILNARLATDGTDVWVAAIGAETELYPYISSDDGEDLGGSTSIASQTDQFVDLATVTAGYTTFVTSQGAANTPDPVQCNKPLLNYNDYQKWTKHGNGLLGLGAVHSPISDGGDNLTGYYQQPKMYVFAFDGSAFTKIGDDPAEFAQGYGSVGNIDFLKCTQIGWMSATASPAEPGVCHVVWSEQGPYGRRGAAGTNPNSVNSAFEVWDAASSGLFGGDIVNGGGAATIGSRVSYSKWDTSGQVSQSDLWTGNQDRTNWFYVNAGSGNKEDAGPPPGAQFSDLFELKNEHGWPALIMAFSEHATYTNANNPSLVTSGTFYSRNGSEGVVRYIDLRTGTPVELQTSAPSLLPSLDDLANPDPDAVAPSIIYQPEPAGDSGGYRWNLGGTVFQKGLATSKMYPDATAGGQNVYSLSLVWRFLTGALSDASSYFRIRADGSHTFEFLDGKRDLGAAPNLRHPSGAPAGRDFALDPLSVWVAEGDVNYPNNNIWRLDRGPCDRWWEILIFLGYGDSDFFFPQNSMLWVNCHGQPVVDQTAGMVYFPGNVEIVTGSYPSWVKQYVFGVAAVKIVDWPCACTIISYPLNVIINVNHAYGRMIK